MDGIAVYVITYNPTDYPGKYVVRRQVAGRGRILIDAEPLGVYDTIDDARTPLIELQLTRFDRDPGDVPAIVEAWL